jgi:hypothetical protein
MIKGASKPRIGREKKEHYLYLDLQKIIVPEANTFFIVILKMA